MGILQGTRYEAKVYLCTAMYVTLRQKNQLANESFVFLTKEQAVQVANELLMQAHLLGLREEANKIAMNSKKEVE